MKMQSIKKLKVLFLDILTDNPSLRKQETKIMGGKTYAEQIQRALNLKPQNFFAVDASRSKFPNPKRYDAIVIGGSYEDPVAGKEKRWMKKVYGYIRRISKDGVPLLGICGGLQFAVRAFNGKVIYNPMGRELGSICVNLTQAGLRDPLFKGLPAKFIIQLSHKCIAKKLLPGWKLLAASPLCKNQAIAIGDKIRLVQFHPELTRKQVQTIARMRKNALIQEGFVKSEAEFIRFMKSIRNTDKAGRKILKNFIRYFVLPRPASK
jgi:GMP synthase-like glutamine amidotransferase